MSDFDSALAVAQVAAPAARPRLLALTGLSGAGKSTAAAALVLDGWRRVRFAAPLKAMLAALGLAPEEIDGPARNRPHPLLRGRTPRHAMQTLGGEWGRGLIAPDLWVALASQAIVRQRAAGCDVVVDDCRYPDEAEMIRALGGEVVRIVRSPPPSDALWGPESRHASERPLPAGLVRAEILNDGAPALLEARIRACAFNTPPAAAAA